MRLSRILAFLAAVFALLLVGTPGQADERAFLTVQLKWHHQAQFAGYYTAEQEGYFADEGVNVHLLEGSEAIDPLKVLADGKADVAEASLRQAELARARGDDVVNIAQIYQHNYLMILCQRQTGLDSISDIRTATFAINGEEFESDINEVLGAIFPVGASPRFVTQLPGIESLTSGAADCMLGSIFNEVPVARNTGMSTLVVDPADYGIEMVQDGLYVSTKRLADPKFRHALAHMIRALHSGWVFASENPESTVRLVLQVNPRLTYEDQTRQLENVLSMISVKTEPFGYYNLENYGLSNALGVPAMTGRLDPGLWTHQVYVAMQHMEGEQGLLTPAVDYYLNQLRETHWYATLERIGTFAAAIAGALMGVRRGYRFWGCFVLALASAVGGGVIRDVVIGRTQLPVWLTRDPSDIYLVFIATVTTEVLRRWHTRNRALGMADALSNRADIVGFSILAIHGAAIAMSAGLSAVWAPLAAAITVSGGSILSDILVAEEHSEYRGRAYEEQALAGSLVLVAGLWIANRHEHSPNVVLTTFIATLIMLLTGRYFAMRNAVKQHFGKNRVTQIPA
jgi:NitT/TauT family transport system substrate-binding protein